MAFLCLGNGFQAVALGPDLFWPIIGLQLFGTWAFSVHCICTLAYLPELTDDVNERTDLNKYSNITLHLTQVFGIALILVMAGGMDNAEDDVAVAKLSQGVGGVYTLILLIIVWYRMMPRRPALHKMGKNESYIAKGYKQLGKTVTMLRKDNRTFFWYVERAVRTKTRSEAMSIIATHRGAKRRSDELHDMILLAAYANNAWWPLAGCSKGTLLSDEYYCYVLSLRSSLVAQLAFIALVANSLR